MKPKKFNKVLTLNKTTISDLNVDQMNEAKGGYWYTRVANTCYTWCGCDTNFFFCKTALFK